jgi:hypothetical protein
MRNVHPRVGHSSQTSEHFPFPVKPKRRTSPCVTNHAEADVKAPGKWVIGLSRAFRDVCAMVKNSELVKFDGF